MPACRLPVAGDASPATLSHAGLLFAPLTVCDLATVGSALDHAVVRARMAEAHRAGPVEHALFDLLADDAAGLSAHWGLSDADGPCGLVALRPFGDALRTITLLCPRVHGTGVNAEVKQVLWAMARHLGVKLVARCNPDNRQSRRAIAKLWPAAVPVRVLDLGREMLVYELTAAPASGTPLDARARRDVHAQLATFAMTCRLSARRAAGQDTFVGTRTRTLAAAVAALPQASVAR